jgi:CheY-like chemotaxis protein
VWQRGVPTFSGFCFFKAPGDKLARLGWLVHEGNAIWSARRGSPSGDYMASGSYAEAKDWLFSDQILPPSIEPRNVLILEDMEERLLLFQDILCKEGTVVDSTSVAGTAIGLLQNDRQYDMVFLDRDLGDPFDINVGNLVTDYLARAECKVSRGVLIIIHSVNTPEARKMLDTLIDAGYTNAHLIPYPILKTKLQEKDFLRFSK